MAAVHERRPADTHGEQRRQPGVGRFQLRAQAHFLDDFRPLEVLQVVSMFDLMFWMRRALLAFGSESASEDRAREQVQRVADPSSQPPASRRSIGAWWPDEGSAL